MLPFALGHGDLELIASLSAVAGGDCSGMSGGGQGATDAALGVERLKAFDSFGTIGVRAEPWFVPRRSWIVGGIVTTAVTFCSQLAVRGSLVGVTEVLYACLADTLSTQHQAATTCASPRVVGAPHHPDRTTGRNYQCH